MSNPYSQAVHARSSLDIQGDESTLPEATAPSFDVAGYPWVHRHDIESLLETDVQE